MCDPGLIAATAASALLGGISQRQAARSADRAQALAVQQRNQTLLSQMEAQQNARDLGIKADTTRQKFDEQRAQEFQSQLAQIAGNRNQEDQARIGARRASLNKAIEQNVVRDRLSGAERQVGSDVTGRVSGAFQKAGKAAQARNVGRARERAGLMATRSGILQSPTELALGVQRLPTTLAPISRRQQDAALADRLRIQGALLTDPEPIQVVNAGSSSADALSALSRAILFAPFMFGGGAQQSSGFAGPMGSPRAAGAESIGTQGFPFGG